MNIDLLCKDQTEIYGEWFVAKPLTKPFIMRVKDAFSVLCGNGVCVTFTESVNLSDIVKDRLKILTKLHNNLQSTIKENNENIIKVVELKLTRELQKMSVSFVGNDLKIKNYDLSVNKQDNLILTDGSKVMDAYLHADIAKFYEDVKFKFLYDKILSLFKDINTIIINMNKKETDE